MEGAANYAGASCQVMGLFKGTVGRGSIFHLETICPDASATHHLVHRGAPADRSAARGGCWPQCRVCVKLTLTAQSFFFFFFSAALDVDTHYYPNVNQKSVKKEMLDHKTKLIRV